MLPKGYADSGQKKSKSTSSTDAFPSWASGMEELGIDTADERVVNALRDMPWKDMGFDDFTPLKALESMNTDEYKRVKARLEAIREREEEENDSSRPLEDEPGAFALMLETTLDYFFLAPTLFLRPDGSFMFEPRKKDVAKMAVILQSTDKGGGENTSATNTLSTGGVGLGIGEPVRDYKPTLMFMPPTQSDGLLKHEDGRLMGADEEDPYIPAANPRPGLVHAESGQLVSLQPQPCESRDPALRRTFKPHIPKGHKYIPKAEFSYDDAFRMCPIMTVCGDDDRGTQARVRLPGISIPLMISGMPRLCAGNLLFSLQRMYRMFGARLPAGMQWTQMCIRLEGSHQPCDPLDDLIPDEDDEDAPGPLDGESLEANTDTAVRVERIPTFVLEPQTATVTVFVTNAPQPLVFGQQPQQKRKSRNKAKDSDDEEEDEDVDAFYAQMLAAKKALPSDWRQQLRKYVPRRAVQRVVLEQVPKSFTLLDLKVAAASLARLELSALEAGTVPMWRECRSEVTEVPLEPEVDEDDAVAEIRRRLLVAAKRHLPRPQITGPAAAVRDEDVDLRKLPASALSSEAGCSYRWDPVELDNSATMWQLELDCRGKEHNVLELQFDLAVCGARSAEAANKAAQEGEGGVTRTEYGVGEATAKAVVKVIEEKQRRKMQQVSYQLARDSGLVSDEDALKGKQEGGACSTKMLIVYMIVYIVAMAAWFMSGREASGKGNVNKVKDTMKGIYGKTKFDL